MTETLFNPEDNNNPIELLVGEGKKFKTVEELAKGKIESDEYIRTLTTRMDELRSDYDKLRGEYSSRESLDELIQKMTNQKLEQRTTSSEQTQNANGVNNQPTYDPKELQSLVSTEFQKLKQTERQQENYQLVRNTLKERLGENYQEVLKQQIESLGVDEETINDMARKNPQVLFRLIGLDTPKSTNTFQTPPRSNQRPTEFTPSTQKRTWSFYQKLRREQPDVYRDPKTGVQMHKDAQALGEDFFDSE